jgi:hypothetical protein
MDIWKRWVDQAILDALSKAIEDRKLSGETADGFARLIEMQVAFRAKIEAEAASSQAAPPRRAAPRKPRKYDVDDLNPNANYGRA